MKLFGSLLLVGCYGLALGVQSAQVVLFEGQVVLGSNGQIVAQAGFPVSLPNGSTGCTVALTGNELPPDHGCFLNGSVTLRTNSVGYESVSRDSGISNSGDMVFLTRKTGLTYVYSGQQGPLAIESDPAPSVAGQNHRQFFRPQMTSSGISFWMASLKAGTATAETGRVLYCKPVVGAPVALVNTNMFTLGLAHSGPSAIDTAYDVSSDGAFYIAVQNLLKSGTPTKHLVRNGVTKLLEQGLPLPSGDTANPVSDVSFPLVNASGSFAARYTLATPAETGIVTQSGHLASASVLDGLALPSGPALGLAVNNRGFVAALWGASGSRVITLHGPNSLAGGRIVVKVGTPIDTSGDWVSDASLWSMESDPTGPQSISLMEDNSVLVRAIWLTSSGASRSGILRFKPPILGDVNRDNEVGPADFALLAQSFGSFAGDANWDADCDLDWDAEVGPSDFSILASEFGTFGP